MRASLLTVEFVLNWYERVFSIKRRFYHARKKHNDGSPEQENKQAHKKDIEPQRDPVKPQEESKNDK
jgi:hypothetical protein